MSAEVAAALATVPLFAHCTDEERAEIARLGVDRRHPSGSVLFQEGEEGTEVLVVLAGRAVVRAGGRALGVVGPGEVLGEMAVVEAATRSGTATVVDDARCLHLATADLDALLDRMPSVARGLLVALSRRLRDRDAGPWR